jgi:hypothetical protein
MTVLEPTKASIFFQSRSKLKRAKILLINVTLRGNHFCFEVLRGNLVSDYQIFVTYTWIWRHTRRLCWCVVVVCFAFSLVDFCINSWRCLSCNYTEPKSF